MTEIWKHIVFFVTLQVKESIHLTHGGRCGTSKRGDLPQFGIINHDVTDWLEIKFSNGFKLVCTTDHPLPIYDSNGNSVRTYAKDIKENDLVALSNLVNSNSKYINVISITPINCCENSFDVETETDRFDVSGICSHNCRTRVISDITDPDNQIVTGRGNLSFTSINLPRLAIEAKGNIEEFYKSYLGRDPKDEYRESYVVETLKRLGKNPTDDLK